MGGLDSRDGVEIRRTAVDGLEMRVVVLGDGDGVLVGALLGILYFEIQDVLGTGVAHWQEETIYILVLVDEYAVLSVLLRGGDGQVASRELGDVASQLILGIYRIVEWTI